MAHSEELYTLLLDTLGDKDDKVSQIQTETHGDSYAIDLFYEYAPGNGKYTTPTGPTMAQVVNSTINQIALYDGIKV